MDSGHSSMYCNLNQCPHEYCCVVIPSGDLGSLPVFFQDESAGIESIPTLGSYLLAANLNSFAFRLCCSAEATGTDLNLFIVEQLPVIAPDDYDRRFGDKTAREIVREHVLELTYTAHDMEPFARDLGYEGPPFVWNEDDRRHLRARLDALYFHLYGLSREDAGYVLETFPIVRRDDEKRFGKYRTKEMVLAYMNALSAGDVGVKVGV